MSLILPINLENLLACSGVESQRVEFKASWDANTTGYQVLKTICAFANDLHNLNGGYLVIGVAENDGRAVLPPAGLTEQALARAQKWIRGNCNRLDPPYQPILSPESLDGRPLLVVWVPPSDTKPHRAPDVEKGLRCYWVRLGAETVNAEKTRTWKTLTTKPLLSCRKRADLWMSYSNLRRGSSSGGPGNDGCPWPLLPGHGRWGLRCCRACASLKG